MFKMMAGGWFTLWTVLACTDVGTVSKPVEHGWSLPLGIAYIIGMSMVLGYAVAKEK